MKEKISPDLFREASACLQESDLERKICLSAETARRCGLEFELVKQASLPVLKPGRPERPVLVSPHRLSRRGFGTLHGRLSLLHAIAHIEFNAINLAWDAICRFQEMPEQYYRDWISVASDETRHFMLLRVHLNTAGHDYGDFDAHEGLWTMAENTAADVLHRMAIVPRVLEARGLDVTPAMIRKFSDIGENGIVTTLETIYREEIEHVRIGDRWFRYLCAQRTLVPETTFIGLVRHYRLDEFKGAINRQARSAAGFSEKELEILESEFVRS